MAFAFGSCGKWSYDRTHTPRASYRANLQKRCLRMSTAPMSRDQRTMCREYL